MPQERRSVLVVEDDAEINALVGAYVELCGFDYRRALDGKTALAEARGEVPALVILDLMLPDVDGFQVCRRLKEDPRTRDVPVILLTALDGAENRRRGRECGAADYLKKPFDPDHIMKAITTHAAPPPVD